MAVAAAFVLFTVAAVLVVTLRTPAGGKVVVEIDQADAEVFVDGKQIEIHVRGDMEPITITGRDDKKHKLEVKKGGYKTHTDTFTYQKGKGKPILVRLKLIPPNPIPQPAPAAMPKEITNSIGMKLKLIPAGKFMMGSTGEEQAAAIRAGEGDPGLIPAEARHEVEISKPFYMGVYEVTQEQYLKVMKVNPSHFQASKGGSRMVKGLDTRNFPVESISYVDAVKFCRLLSGMDEEKKAGRVYRLPTEAEWEYACRGGSSSTAFHFGNSLSSTLANINGNYPFGGAIKGPHLQRTCEVGSYKANGCGLYDMHGNVWEWCADWFDEGYYSKRPKPDKDPTGPISGSTRVMRGGGYQRGASGCRSAYKNGYLPEHRDPALGFRVAMSLIGDFKDQPAQSSTTSEDAKPILLPPSQALEALRRDKIAPEALELAGDGDPKQAPASLVGVLGEVQPIHSQQVLGLAYSPDGRWLASGSVDKTIMLRDTATGRVKRILKGHTGSVTAVGFSKDSRKLVSAGQDGTLRLWSPDKDEKPTVVEAKLGHPVILAMAVSPDGRYVAAGGASGLIKLWKWGAWENPIAIETLVGKVKGLSLTFSPDGKRLACGCFEFKEKVTQVRLFASADGALTGSLPLNHNEVMALAFSHNGKYLAAVGHIFNGRVWEMATGKSVAELTRRTLPGEWHTSHGVAWSPDDKMLALSTDFQVRVYDFPAATQRIVRWVRTSGRSLAFSPRGDRLALGAADGDVPIWDTKKWDRQHLEHGHRHHVSFLAVSSIGPELLSLGDEMGSVLRWQINRSRLPIVRQLELGNFYAARSA